MPIYPVLTGATASNTTAYTGSSFTATSGLGTATPGTLTLSLPSATAATAWADMPHFFGVMPYTSPYMIDVKARLAAVSGNDGTSFFPIALRDDNTTANILIFIQAEGSGNMTVYDQSGLKALSVGRFSFTGSEWIRFVILDGGTATVYYGTGAAGSQTWTVIWTGQLFLPATPKDFINLTFNQYQGVGAAGTVSVQWADITSTLMTD